MLVLWEQDAQGVNRIAQRLHLETNTITPLLQRLEQKGLILKKRSPADERSTEVHLSESGRMLQKQAETIPIKILGAFQNADLSFEEVKSLQQTLFKLLHTLKEKVN